MRKPCARDSRTPETSVTMTVDDATTQKTADFVNYCVTLCR
jgi:hypothetical protein